MIISERIGRENFFEPFRPCFSGKNEFFARLLGTFFAENRLNPPANRRFSPPHPNLEPNMNVNRWAEVASDLAHLTQEEANVGWHFCVDWDLLLIGPGMPEAESCTCFGAGHRIFHPTEAEISEYHDE